MVKIIKKIKRFLNSDISVQIEVAREMRNYHISNALSRDFEEHHIFMAGVYNRYLSRLLFIRFKR